MTRPTRSVNLWLVALLFLLVSRPACTTRERSGARTETGTATCRGVGLAQTLPEAFRAHSVVSYLPIFADRRNVLLLLDEGQRPVGVLLRALVTPRGGGGSAAPYREVFVLDLPTHRLRLVEDEDGQAVPAFDDGKEYRVEVSYGREGWERPPDRSDPRHAAFVEDIVFLENLWLVVDELLWDYLQPCLEPQALLQPQAKPVAALLSTPAYAATSLNCWLMDCDVLGSDYTSACLGCHGKDWGDWWDAADPWEDGWESSSSWDWNWAAGEDLPPLEELPQCDPTKKVVGSGSGPTRTQACGAARQSAQQSCRHQQGGAPCCTLERCEAWRGSASLAYSASSGGWVALVTGVMNK